MQLAPYFCPNRKNVVEYCDCRPEMLGREVRVAEGHRERAVPQRFLHFLQRTAPLDAPRGERVAQVVEPEVLDLRPP